MKPVDVLIIGAGLAGLACARRLLQCGISFQIIEASDAVGGRVRTDLLDGFRLDRGFQIYLPSYPEGRRVLDYDRLELKSFTRGAKVWFNGRFHRVADPRAELLTAVKSLTNPIGTFADKLRLARFARMVLKGSLTDQTRLPEQSMRDLLREAGGFSEKLRDRLFRPFLGGVFLEQELLTSSRFGRFVFRQFAEGPGAVPSKGMQAIPEQIASGLPADQLRLNARVTSYNPGQVVLENGETILTRAVVLATEADEAVRLVGSEQLRSPGWNSTANLYFAAPYFEAEPILLLDGEGKGPLNTAVVMSAASADYAPAGQSLISCSTIGLPAISDVELESRSRHQLQQWFGSRITDWRLLRIYRIPHALPRMLVGQLEPWQRPVRLRPGLYVCGDHRDNSSINGALESGFRAAQAVADDLANQRA